MQNDDLIKRALYTRNKHAYQHQNKTIEKEKLSRSQRTYNKSNHVHYYSKYSFQNNNNINKEKEISKALSFNDIDDDEDLDHPKPLISDNEEDFDMFKGQFIKKLEKKKTLDDNLKSGKNQNLNLKYIPKSNEIPNNIDFSYKEFSSDIEIKNKNRELKNTDIDNNKKNENYIPFKKIYNSETVKRKQINQIKNKNNHIISNNDIINSNCNTDKKIKPKNGHIIVIKRKKHKCENTSLNNLNEINSQIIQKDKRNNINNQIINENYNYLNIQNDDNRKYMDSNQNNNSKKKIIYIQKKQAHSICIPLNKIKCENDIMRKTIHEECEKNNSQEKLNQTEPTTNIKICQNSSKIKNLLKRKTIQIKDINNSSPNKEIILFNPKENMKQIEILYMKLV